jgi:hypothetical protein
MKFIKSRIWFCLLLSIIFIKCKEPAKSKSDETVQPSDSGTPELSSYPSKTDPTTIDDEDNSDDEDDNNEENNIKSSNRIEDGSYTATVNYFNPGTNYSATYTLSIEVSDGQVVQINFPNDGYLDDDHISAADIDENGDASVEGEDGKTYEVHINL